MIYNLVKWPVSLPKNQCNWDDPPKVFFSSGTSWATRSQAPKPQISMRKTCGFPRRSMVKDGEILIESSYNSHEFDDYNHLKTPISPNFTTHFTTFHHTFHHISPHFTTFHLLFHLLCHAYHHSNFNFGGLTRSWPSAVGSRSSPKSWTKTVASPGRLKVVIRAESWWVLFGELPSGNLTVCYWKWPLIVDFPINSEWLSQYGLNYGGCWDDEIDG